MTDTQLICPTEYVFCSDKVLWDIIHGIALIGARLVARMKSFHSCPTIANLKPEEKKLYDRSLIRAKCRYICRPVLYISCPFIHTCFCGIVKKLHYESMTLITI
ncbi:hypothetical protein GDO78_009873 [Eleutherodactylus coqui]|uniref:Uncharacterized protein n=1 Tax=Eleutherodactylus coqui TaxID=57060 RepID=A0A8J6K8Y4_ELECQ|nr:hypothetical protein GDO78_009873 [Eleutherodactylus coqui]